MKNYFNGQVTVMPLTGKGKKILSKMEDEYGSKKGTSVFYASKNAGKIKGVEGSSKKKKPRYSWNDGQP